MDRELISYFDARFGEVSERIETLHQETTQQIAALRDEMNQRFEKVDERFERVEVTVHHTQITVEAMRGDVQLLAEGVIGQDEKLQAHSGQVTFRLDEIKAMVGPCYRSLDRRVQQLEEQAAREGRDPIDVIRQRFGKSTQ